MRRLLPRRLRHAFRLYWLTDDIVVSGEPGPRDWPTVVAAGVRAVVDLRAESPDGSAIVHSLGLAYMRLPVYEHAAPTERELELVTDWILRRISTDGPVLIHCREGRGRSPLVACASIVKLGIPAADAYQMLQRARPEIALSTPQVDLLQRFAAAHGG